MAYHQTYQHIHENPRQRERKKQATIKKPEEIMAQNFPNFMKVLNLYIQEVQQI